MKFSVQGRVINSYMTNRHVDVRELSKRISIPEKELEAYLGGTNEIEQVMLEKLASGLRVSWLAFLVSQPEPEYSYGNDNRTKQNQKQSLNLDTLTVLDEAEYLLETANEIAPNEPFLIEGFKPSQKKPELSAQQLRKILKITTKEINELGRNDDYAVLRYWKSLFSSHGLYIFEKSWTSSTLRAFSLVRGRKAVAVLSTGDQPLGRVFSLLHEVFHIVNKQPGLCDFHSGIDEDMEVLCNRFAAAMLMPEEEFQEYADATGLSTDRKDEVSEHDVYLLRKYFKASRLSVYRRLQTCGYITKSFYQSVQDGYEDFLPKSASKGGGNFYRNRLNAVGQKYVGDTFSWYGEKKIGARSLATLLNVRVSQLSQLTDMVGGHGKKK